MTFVFAPAFCTLSIAFDCADKAWIIFFASRLNSAVAAATALLL
jgi:hypothetical protein